ncbi:MAG: galactose-1-phosphate uridylyltransferase [Gammaproteobacteria bacterium]|nr:galactose-1-phosphate uridylyltransferase [Gammaproteobacteria bacterium]
MPRVHRRHDPLLDEWVLVSPQRDRRPWQGQQETPAPPEPVWRADCHLCPGNLRANGERNPDHEGVHVFDNDFPALLDAPAEPGAASAGSDLLQSQPVRGRCRVLSYSPRHDLSLARMDDAGREQVVTAWVEQTRELGREFRWVQCFENRGAMMGASSPHPHGQIWALDALPTQMRPGNGTPSWRTSAARVGICCRRYWRRSSPTVPASSSTTRTGWCWCRSGPAGRSRR